uniref:Uncharacterized protein n=1 Tax=viral metagenome TaxID=1070528 RepID=A0A6M3XLF0_9ZZZZ
MVRVRKPDDIVELGKLNIPNLILRIYVGYFIRSGAACYDYRPISIKPEIIIAHFNYVGIGLIKDEFDKAGFFGGIFYFCYISCAGSGDCRAVGSYKEVLNYLAGIGILGDVSPAE